MSRNQGTNGGLLFETESCHQAKLLLPKAANVTTNIIPKLLLLPPPRVDRIMDEHVNEHGVSTMHDDVQPWTKNSFPKRGQLAGIKVALISAVTDIRHLSIKDAP
ncbi:hypothetical protein L6452_14853 [Arctium lappa]|uniref:Uncharacterized protein n=1 Tax=Arctium lappa TaxID=4217 RepID=A0ACB9CM88_ARCLA|nr:hypothetical protein L6452_14853 [Arctium lappa]